MKRAVIVMALAALIATPAFAQYSVNIWLGIRETGSTAPIGDDGGTAGSLEWVDLDNQTLVLDGTWQRFVFDLDALPLTAFTGNGVLDGDAGVIEHIRIDSNAYGGAFKLWIDDLVNTVDAGFPPAPTDFVINDWESAAVGDESTFQEPGFSGSTAGQLKPSPNIAFTTDAEANTGLQSYQVEYEWLDQADNRWLRLTTFNGTFLPGTGSPTISFINNSVVSFWMKGIPEPSTLALLGLGMVSVLRRRR